MKFSLAAAAAAAFGMIGSVNANCDKGPYVSTSVGQDLGKAPGYQQFCEARWEEGLVITGIRVWAGKWQVKAVQFQYAGDDWGPRYGQLPDDVQPKERTWDELDEIKMRVWNNKPDDGDPVDAVGWIQILQDGKDKWDAGCDAGKTAKKENYVDNPSGKLMAVRGAAGAWVSTLEFKFLESPVKAVEMVSMNFKEDYKRWSSEKKGKATAMMGSQYFMNESPAGGPNATYSFTTRVGKSKSKEISTSQTHTAGYKLGITVGGKVGVPLLAEGSVDVTNEFSYQYTNMKSINEAETDTYGWDWTMGGPGAAGIAPQTAAHCTAEATSGSFESDYDAVMEATMASGKKYQYKNFGHFASVGYANGKTGCKVIPLKDVPANGEKKNVTPKKTKRSTRLSRFLHAL